MQVVHEVRGLTQAAQLIAYYELCGCVIECQLLRLLVPAMGDFPRRTWLVLPQ
jgi:hypothetical protein